MSKTAKRFTGREADLLLAGVHLRLGSLALARSELEALAGRDGLDESGLVDLAEARWRTGDLEGAGEAADAAIHDGEGPLLALIVAAEAAAARGRPTEARGLADRALAAAGGSIDRWFAGMPRASVWPADVHAPPPAPSTKVGAGPGMSRRARPATAALAPEAPALAPALAPASPDTLALWEPGGRPEVAGAPDLPGPVDELERGRAALDAGDIAEATIRLALTLRLGPALAPAVLDLVRDQPARELAIVRGDAYRLVGRELEARHAFGDAARSGDPDVPSPGDDRDEPAPSEPQGDRP